MSVELELQLREYCRELEQRQGALSVADIFEGTEKVQSIPRWGGQQRSSRRRWIAAVAAALIFLTTAIGIRLFNAVDPAPEPAGPTPTTTIPAPTEATDHTLPALGLPGTTPNLRTGEFGWTGALGLRGWVHKVVEDLPSSPGEYRQTQIVFAVENDCFPATPGADPTPVTVAGLYGLYLEPYDDETLPFVRPPLPPQSSLEPATGAYALPIADRTLCVYLFWDPTTTPEELSALRAVVESIRGEPFGEDGIRINFTLNGGWDTG